MSYYTSIARVIVSFGELLFLGLCKSVWIRKMPCVKQNLTLISNSGVKELVASLLHCKTSAQSFHSQRGNLKPGRMSCRGLCVGKRGLNVD